MQALEEKISKATGVPIYEIKGRSRVALVCEARMAVWFIAKKHLGLGFSQIGRYYGRDHATIISGVSKIEFGKIDQRIINAINEVLKEDLTRSLPEQPASIQIMTLRERRENAKRLGITLNRYLEATFS